MRFFLAAIAMAALSVPAIATEPLPSMADYLVMRCGALGVTNVFMNAEDEPKSYARDPKSTHGHAARKACIMGEYAAAKGNPGRAFPVSPGNATHAMTFTIKANGTLVLR